MTGGAGKRFRVYAGSMIVYVVVRIMALTLRVRFTGTEHRARAEALHPRGSFCMALWHEQLFAGIVAHRKMRFAPLASLSGDGAIVSFVMNRLGFRTIRGSSSRGGPKARDQLVAITEEGWFTAITVDGPTGPRRRVKGGVVDIARRGGVAILPMVALAKRSWVLAKSWDQFRVPKPFSKIEIRYGAPIVVAPETAGLAFGDVKARVKAALLAAEAQ